MGNLALCEALNGVAFDRKIANIVSNLTKSLFLSNIICVKFLGVCPGVGGGMGVLGI